MNEIKSNFKKWVYWFVLAICIIGIYKLLDNFTMIADAIGKFINIITPFLMGLLIAYILHFPASRFEDAFKKSKSKILSKKAKALGILTAYMIAILVMIIIINIILPPVIESIIELINSFQGYYEIFLKNISELPEDSIWKSEYVNNILNAVKNLDFSEVINVDTIMQYAKGAIGIATSIFDVFVTIVVSAYALVERGKMAKFAKRLSAAMFDENTCKKLDIYFKNSNQIFFKFLSSQVIDAIIVGILATLAMSILKVRYAVLLGFMIGLFNIIPYFGAIVAVGIAILITFITGGFSQAIWMAIWIIILQQIDANIINPKIVGNSLEISPLLIIFSVTVGGAYFGILGMFLAVPIAAVLKILINDYIELKEQK